MLSPMQRGFVVAFLRHGNATRAAEEAGYKHPNKMGVQVMASPQVKAEIARLSVKIQEAADKKIIADGDEVREFFTKVMRADQLRWPSHVKKGSKTPSLNDRMRAGEMLARVLGIVVERREHSGKLEHEHSVLPTREQAVEALREAIRTNPELRQQLRLLLEETTT